MVVRGECGSPSEPHLGWGTCWFAAQASDDTQTGFMGMMCLHIPGSHIRLHVRCRTELELDRGRGRGGTWQPEWSQGCATHKVWHIMCAPVRRQVRKAIDPSLARPRVSGRVPGELEDGWASCARCLAGRTGQSQLSGICCHQAEATRTGRATLAAASRVGGLPESCFCQPGWQQGWLAGPSGCLSLAIMDAPDCTSDPTSSSQGCVIGWQSL